MRQRGRCGRRRVLAGTAAAAVLLAARTGRARDDDRISVGVLRYGTVRWELDVIRRHALDRSEGFILEPIELASDQASDTAILGGSVDFVVSDWLWVSRQNNSGAGLTTFPYSATVGALMAAPAAAIASVADLRGRRLGVAGGALDKGWLLLRALAEAQHGVDLEREADIVFGAAPLLTEKLRQGELDAVLDYWQYATRLEAEGFRRVVGVEDIVAALGVPGRVPQLVYVFAEGWVRQRPKLVGAFARASRRAKTIMRESDAEWTALRPLMGDIDDEVFALMRRRFREGIVDRWGPSELSAAQQLHALLVRLGGDALVGPAAQLAAGTFWTDGGD